MTIEITAVLLILGIALYLFISERLRMDVVALLVLAVLAIGGLVSMNEALAGFSNPAVVTVWAMFILSAGLSATGVASIIGQKVLRLAGSGEVRMIIVIMLTAGVLSAFMNNIGVAALMLPVVMEVARRTKTPPSRLLMPMAYGSLLGGLTTLIGTPPNLVASTSLRLVGFEGFSLFEFTPIGLPALLAGTLYVAFVGRHFLPKTMPAGMEGTDEESGLKFSYDLGERRFRLRVGTGSPLAGRSLKDSKLSTAIGLNVIFVNRGGKVLSHPGADFVLTGGDILTTQGRVENFREFLSWQALEMAKGTEILEVLAHYKVAVVKAVLSGKSKLVGLTVRESDFRARFGAYILEIRRGRSAHREKIGEVVLKEGDALILEMRGDSLSELRNKQDFSKIETLESGELAKVYPESDKLIELIMPPESHLAGKTVAQSGLGESLRLRIVGIARKGGAILFPAADEVFKPGDQLLTVGGEQTFDVVQAIQSLNLVHDGDGLIPDDEPQTKLVEVTLSPRSNLNGKTLRELDFRKRYGVEVLSIWRRGRAYRSHLHSIRLEFGDALLLSSSGENTARLARDPDFLVISGGKPLDDARHGQGKTILAGGLMLAVVAIVLLGWLPIAIAAVAGAALMVACRCLSMEDAYRAIEWKSVFLIAGMIPLGTAMETSGAAQWIAEGMSAIAAPFGLLGMLAGLYVLTALATTIVPTTALVLIMAPIAISTSTEMGLDPKLLMMAVAMAASASFTSPISHPANVLVMGPGGYRFMDYVRMGVGLALVVAVTVLPLIVWIYM